MLGLDKKKHAGGGTLANVYGKAYAEIIGQGSVDYDYIIASIEQLSFGRAHIGYRLDRIIYVFGKQIGNAAIEFICRRNKEQAVNLLFEFHCASPSLCLKI